MKKANSTEQKHSSSKTKSKKSTKKGVVEFYFAFHLVLLTVYYDALVVTKF